MTPVVVRDSRSRADWIHGRGFAGRRSCDLDGTGERAQPITFHHHADEESDDGEVGQRQREQGVQPCLGHVEPRDAEHGGTAIREASRCMTVTYLLHLAGR